MTMNLYKLFSSNVQIQYKGCILSQAMFFTLLTTLLNIILPFIIAHRSGGFWLRSSSFYEQPKVHFSYDYLLIVETEDSSRPILCGAGPAMEETLFSGKENCAEIQVQEYDSNRDGSNDFIDLKVHLIVPRDNTIISLLLILGLNYQLKNVCPLYMQSLAVITMEFPMPPSGFRYLGDLHMRQIAHLPCAWNVLDTRYNTSLFDAMDQDDKAVNFVLDPVLESYFKRDVTTETKAAYTRTQIGHTGVMDMKFSLRIPETQVLYTPSLMQQLIWAWPQYLALFIIFYWIFDRIKGLVFRNRLLMAWEVVPWKK